MNTLQRLAIRRIKRLTESLNPHLPAYQLAKTWTDEECQTKDKEAAVQWTEITQAIQEINELADALAGG